MKLYVFPEDGIMKMLRNQPEDSVNHLSNTADLRPIYKTNILHRKKINLHTWRIQKEKNSSYGIFIKKKLRQRNKLTKHQASTVETIKYY